MATRLERVPGGVKQKNMAAAGRGVHRRALGDIGNLVTVRGAVEGKPLPHVSKPITSFRAQLLAKAKEAADARNNNKKCVPDNGGGGGAFTADHGVLPQIEKPAEKNAVTKPKPEVVTEKSADSGQTKELENKKTGVFVLPGKKASTLTSTLTARSKVASGLSKKSNLQIVVDIDAADANNELAVVEYVEDLYKFYKLSENECRVGDYMHSQPEINKKMRAILIDWLTEVHLKFKLYPETLYLTIHIIDRYLALKTTRRKELQLLGMSAMLVASKYEEIWAPPVNDFVCISDGTYTHEQILAMEKSILGELQWKLTVPTLYVFLLRFIKASIPDSNMENMAYFLAELGMMNYATILHPASMVVYAARCTLNKSPFWDETLKLHTGYSEKQLMDCAKLLVSFHAVAPEQKLRASYKKYSSSERGAVALFPPAKSLLAIPA